MIFFKGIQLPIAPKANSIFQIIHILEMSHPLIVNDLKDNKPLQSFHVFLAEKLLLFIMSGLGLFDEQIAQVFYIQEIKGLLSNIGRPDLWPESKLPEKAV